MRLPEAAHRPPLTARRCLPLSLACLLGIAVATPALADEATPQAAAPQAMVWQPATALSMPAAADWALARNRLIEQAHTAVEQARAGVEQASARPNPTLSLTSQHYRSRTTGVGQQPDHIVAFSSLWERGDKRQLRIAQADAWIDAAQANEADARRQVLHDARWAWIDLWAAERQEQLAEQTALTYDASVAAADQRLRAGDLPGADVARMRVEAQRAQGDLQTARVDHRHAQAALATVLACEAQASELHTDGQLPAVATWTATDREHQVDQRPDVRSALAAAQAARQAVALAQAQRSRDVGWSLIAEHDQAAGTGNTLGVSVSVPLQWGNTYQGDIHRAVADLRAAEQRLQQARANALADASRSEADLRDAHTQAQRYTDAVLVTSQRAAEAAEFAYAHGASSVMDLLDARRTLHAVQSATLQAQATWLKAAADRDAALAVADAFSSPASSLPASSSPDTPLPSPMASPLPAQPLP